ncbi:carboxypeptidase-like regulatory domain-containing protein [Gimesia aquarii]|uniref:Carboxypeptidase regulatory-like domain-containing protein n=1 Tax=Gimesia aquarii TaxID=2527964 RepID=A0A517WWX6_9PLAN|nr:carboxypeptidase-like regulatory domain-containing protein [Gimesia aquarii]QDU09775.1 hypothetical protein V202x_31710 [Gimesia aquarii]
MRNDVLNRMKQVTSYIAISSILLLQGCGGAEDTRPARNVVSGVVTYNGTPVEEAIVVFRPAEQAGGQTANGRTNAEGAFTMGTFEGTDGVVAGDYKVMISKMETTGSSDALPEDDPNYDPNPKPEPPPKNLLPEKYASVDTSGLTVSVKDGEDKKDLKFELTD